MNIPIPTQVEYKKDSIAVFFVNHLYEVYAMGYGRERYLQAQLGLVGPIHPPFTRPSSEVWQKLIA